MKRSSTLHPALLLRPGTSKRAAAEGKPRSEQRVAEDDDADPPRARGYWVWRPALRQLLLVSLAAALATGCLWWASAAGGLLRASVERAAACDGGGCEQGARGHANGGEAGMLDSWGRPLASLPSQPQLTRQDLLVVMPSSSDRLAVVRATRAWREGIRTVLVFEAPLDVQHPPEHFEARERHVYSEFFTYSPDVPADLPHTGPGDVRFAMAPVLAAAQLGTHSFKWLLYGHDDTLWAVDSVLEYLQGLDPNMPYLLTDQLRRAGDVATGARGHMSRDVARCLPCGHEDAARTADLRSPGWSAPRGCPCTGRALCHSDASLQNFHENCTWRPGRRPIPDGGAGIILSAGLLRLLPFQVAYAWLQSQTQLGPGDALLAQLLQEATGIYPSDPGYEYNQRATQVFDPDWRLVLQPGMQNSQPVEQLGVMTWLHWALLDAADAAARAAAPASLWQRFASNWRRAPRCGRACHDVLIHTLSVQLDPTRLDGKITVQPYGGDGPPRWHVTAYAVERLAQLLEDYHRLRRRGGAAAACGALSSNC